jgi:hypothetical protein
MSDQAERVYFFTPFSFFLGIFVVNDGVEESALERICSARLRADSCPSRERDW